MPHTALTHIPRLPLRGMYACYLQTEAEKAGWEFSKKEGIPLVVINPTFVLGPVVGKRADATSIIDFKVQLSSSPAY